LHHASVATHCCCISAACLAFDSSDSTLYIVLWLPSS
jgi:hypothetical protein